MMCSRQFFVILVALLCCGHANSFSPGTLRPESSHHRRTQDLSSSRSRHFVGTKLSHGSRLILANSFGDQVINEELLQSLRSMRVRELKSELESLNISTRDALEKEELIQRLYNARTSMSVGVGVGVGDDGVSKRKKKKKRRVYDDVDVDNNYTTETEIEQPSEREFSYSTNPSSTSTTFSTNGSITVPFTYYELGSQSVAAQNKDDVYIRPSPGKYAAIELQLKKDGQSPVEWTLLVDTACSGLVLSPDAVSRANQQCPGIIQTINNAGTMTMAGSSQGAAVAKWDSYTKMMVQGVEINHANVAACQDIGALPAGLDGILGLSFLDQFACVDFDFANNELRMDRTETNPLIPNMNDIVAQGPLSLTKLRIYTADMTLDGRPVKLLVDSGAASSFLNWNGVTDMRLSMSSPQIEPIREQIGAMGADNMALQLTHRFKLRRRWNLESGGQNFLPGIGLQDGQVADIDIGDLPVLEALKGDGVGGILGADLLMMCDVVRFSGLNGRSPMMTLMKQEL